MPAQKVQVLFHVHHPPLPVRHLVVAVELHFTLLALPRKHTILTAAANFNVAHIDVRHAVQLLLRVHVPQAEQLLVLRRSVVPCISVR